MYLTNLPKLKGKTRTAKRVGRGVGSGKGSHTSGNGQKGQKSRTGYNLPVGFEGGQVPLYKKMPKQGGFINTHRVATVAVNVSALNVFKDGDKVTKEELINKGVVSQTKSPIKILGTGDLTKKLELTGFTYSASAKEQIEKLGGKAE